MYVGTSPFTVSRLTFADLADHHETGLAFLFFILFYFSFFFIFHSFQTAFLSRIFYLASRIFLSRISHFLSRISHFPPENFFLLLLSRISNVPYRLPYKRFRWFLSIPATPRKKTSHATSSPRPIPFFAGHVHVMVQRLSSNNILLESQNDFHPGKIILLSSFISGITGNGCINEKNS